MGFANRMELNVRVAEYELEPQRYLITGTNKVHCMGNVTVELPVNAASVPFEPDMPGVAYVQWRSGVFGHSIVYGRMDTTTECLEFFALLNTIVEQRYREETKQRYIARTLQPLDGEYELVRSAVPYGLGELHFIKTENMLTVPCHVRYHAIYVVNKMSCAPMLYFEHYIQCPNTFSAGSLEAPKVTGLSDVLYRTLKTVKTESEVMYIN